MNPAAPVFKPSTTAAVKAALKKCKGRKRARATATRAAPVSEARDHPKQPNITPLNLEDLIRAKLEKSVKPKARPLEPKQGQTAPLDFEDFIRRKLTRSMDQVGCPFELSTVKYRNVQAKSWRDAGAEVAIMPMHEDELEMQAMRQQLQSINFQAEDTSEQKDDDKGETSVLTKEERSAWLQEKLAKAKKDFAEKQQTETATQSVQNEQPLHSEPRHRAVEIQLQVMKKIRRVGELQRERKKQEDGSLIAVGAKVPSYFWADRM